jgi:hypothetical protein
VAVEVLAGPVVAHRGARVGVAGGDLHVCKSTPASKPVVTKVWRSMCGVRPGDPDACSVSQAPQASSGGMAVHPDTAAVQQDRPAGTGPGWPVDSAPNGWRQRDEDDLGAFAAANEDVWRTARVTPWQAWTR